MDEGVKGWKDLATAKALVIEAGILRDPHLIKVEFVEIPPYTIVYRGGRFVTPNPHFFQIFS
jgi:hypothetical protein